MVPAGEAGDVADAGDDGGGDDRPDAEDLGDGCPGSLDRCCELVLGVAYRRVDAAQVRQEVGGELAAGCFNRVLRCDRGEDLGGLACGDPLGGSAATYMDLWYLVRMGRLPGVALSQVWSLAQDPGINVRAAAITAPIAEQSTSAPIDSLADPWDRFIVATAAIRGLPLVTRDQPIADLGVVQVVW